MARKSQEISIYRIAKEAGVAVTTVSRVINRRNGISEATREKINVLLVKYDFSPNYPVQRATRIAVVMPVHACSPYLTKALEGIFDYVNQHHLIAQVVLFDPSKGESLLSIVREQQCAGAIVIFQEIFQQELHELSNAELPVIILDTRTNDTNIGFIDNDSYSGSCAATQHLLERGHRKIGYLTEVRQFLNEIERLKGFEHTMAAAGCDVPEARIIKYAGSTEIHPNQQGAIAMRQLLKNAPDITAVMTAGDTFAFGAMTAIHEMGLKIPEDISVVGFDNYPETAGWYPALTTVDHPIEKGGYMAAEAIHAGLSKPGSWIPPQEILPTKMVIRKSTGPVKGQALI